MSGEVLTEVANSIAWFTAGLVIGFLVGRLRREIREIREVVVDGEPPTRVRHHRSGRLGERALGVIVLLLAVATVVQGIVFERQQARVTACQTRFVDDFTDALRVRDRIADEGRENAREDRDSISKWLQDLLAADPADRQRITEEYLAGRTQLAKERRVLDQKRTGTPLPMLPKECE
jgi:hypothetical protein